MAEPRYFFSPDGSETLGPVGISELQQLVDNRTLKEGSFLCPEGNTLWQEIDLDFFAPPADLAPEPAVAPEPESPVSETLIQQHAEEAAPPETDPAPPPESAPVALEPESTEPPQHRAVIPKRRSKTSRRLPQIEEPDLFAHFGGEPEAGLLLAPEPGPVSAPVVTPPAEPEPEPESLLVPPAPAREPEPESLLAPPETAVETPPPASEPAPPSVPEAEALAPLPGQESPIITVPHYYAPPVRRPATSVVAAAKRSAATVPVPAQEPEKVEESVAPRKRRGSRVLAWSAGILLGAVLAGVVWKLEMPPHTTTAAPSALDADDKPAPHPDSYPGLLRPPAK